VIGDPGSAHGGSDRVSRGNTNRVTRRLHVQLLWLFAFAFAVRLLVASI